MDPVTHALSGALAGRALSPSGAEHRLRRAATWTGVAAVLAPDLDYLLRLLADPLTYLNWHRTFTHALPLLPLWAVLLAWLLRPARRLLGMRRVWALCLAGMALHVAGDLITPFGTTILWPLSGRRFSLESTFVVDPLVTAPLAAGLLAGARWGPRRTALAALAAAAAVVGIEAALHERALGIARAHAAALGLPPDRARALPQPLSPLRWKLVVETPRGYEVAHVRLGAGGVAHAAGGDGWLERIASAYRPAGTLRWEPAEHPARGRRHPLAAAAWARPELEGFRRFAALPFVLAASRDTAGRECVWLSDLRFVVPGLPPPFRFEVCRAGGGEGWSLRHLPRRPRGAQAPFMAD